MNEWQTDISSPAGAAASAVVCSHQQRVQPRAFSAGQTDAASHLPLSCPDNKTAEEELI